MKYKTSILSVVLAMVLLITQIKVVYAEENNNYQESPSNPVENIVKLEEGQEEEEAGEGEEGQEEEEAGEDEEEQEEVGEGEEQEEEENGEDEENQDKTPPLISDVEYSLDGSNFHTFPEGAVETKENIYIRAHIVDEQTQLPASGIKEATVTFGGVEYVMSDKENDVYEAAITPGKHQTIEGDITVAAMDNAENETQVLAGKVRYDACEPVINVALMSGNAGVSGWFSEAVNENPLYLAIQYNDDTAVQKIQVSEDDSFGNILWDQQVEDASGSVTTTEGLISGEQDKAYYVRAIDKMGNISNSQMVQVKIDNTKPSEEVSVAFSGSDSMQTTLEPSEGEGYCYKIASIEGNVSDTQTITMKIYIADAQQNNASGIDTAKLTLAYENEIRTYQCAREGGDLAIATDEEGNDFISFTTDVFSSNGRLKQIFR